MAQAGQGSVVDERWELIDPNPDIHELFVDFNKKFFYGKLTSVYVKWSQRMTLCAGLCRYHGRNGECSIHLSKPLLQLRRRKDLVETLLHEMIHAYLFVADNDRERESHGPKFQEHMNRINHLTGAKITIYHSFRDEVDYYKTHWWKCNGRCVDRPPYFGIVKRSMNRAPGPNDIWYSDHEKNCGGKFSKIKEPPPKPKATTSVKRKHDDQKGKSSQTQKLPKIDNIFKPVSASSTNGSSAGSFGVAVSRHVNATPLDRLIPTPPKSSTNTNTHKPPPPSATSSSSGYLVATPPKVANDSNRPTASAVTGSSTSPPTSLGALYSAKQPFSGKGFVLGSSNLNAATSSGAQPFRRGDHPLLQRLFGSATAPSSASASDSTPVASRAPVARARITSEVSANPSASSSSQAPASFARNRKPSGASTPSGASKSSSGNSHKSRSRSPHLGILVFEQLVQEAFKTDMMPLAGNSTKSESSAGKTQTGLNSQVDQRANLNNPLNRSYKKPEAKGGPEIEVIDLE